MLKYFVLRYLSETTFRRLELCVLKSLVLTYLSETTKQIHGAGPYALQNSSHKTNKTFGLFTFYLTTLSVAQITQYVERNDD
jgi:hypothetical protein